MGSVTTVFCLGKHISGMGFGLAHPWAWGETFRSLLQRRKWTKTWGPCCSSNVYS